MAEGALLLRRLRRVRRRARALAALEGGVGGLAGGAALAAATALAAHALGRAVPWRVGGGLGAASLLVGAVWAATRRLPLSRCARLVDATLDGGGVSRDRVLSALAFVEGQATPFARAAIADALARAQALRPALIAPAHPPRALPALAAALSALALVGAWPTAAPGARSGVAAVTAARPTTLPLTVAPRALDVEREEARAAREAARRADDADLGALADELGATLAALTAGALDRGAALERVSALAARARAAADESAHERDGLGAAGAALERERATRAVGQRLAGSDPAATEQALHALAEGAAAAGAQGRDDVAGAFARAAAGAARAGGGATTAGGQGDPAAQDGQDDQDARRRLRRDDERGGDAPDASHGGDHPSADERHLERLRRQLDETATACRAEPETCRRALDRRASDFATAQRHASGAEARRRLESAVSQLRERLRRGALDGPSPGAAERAFLRAARGDGGEGARSPTQRPSIGGDRADGQPGDGKAAIARGEVEAADGDGDDGLASGTSDEAEGPAGDTTTEQGEAAAEGAAARGSGVGRNAGGEALGGRQELADVRGLERQVRLRDGAGPTRAEVIEAAARRGFATSDYGRVFGDYAPVAEQAIASAAVPEGRRYVVRRYFQLIRPRTRTAAVRTP